MGANQSIRYLNLSSFVRAGLISLIHCLAMVGVALAIAGSASLRAQRDVRIPISSYMPPDFPATVDAVIPTPQYLPAGYELWRIYKDPADGFGTGKAEIEAQYRDPRCWARKTTCSLQVFVSPMTDGPLSGTASRTPERLSLRIGNRTVRAQYFNVMGTDLSQGNNPLPNGQQPGHEASDFNALIFPFDHFMVAIRGNRAAGVGRSELIRMAKSLTYTSR
jgi:hypothetical protein